MVHDSSGKENVPIQSQLDDMETKTFRAVVPSCTSKDQPVGSPPETLNPIWEGRRMMALLTMPKGVGP